MKKITIYIIASLVFSSVTSCGIVAQNQVARFIPQPYPDRIVLNITQDPSRSIAVNWRTNTTVEQGLLEIMEVSANPVDSAMARVINAKTEKFSLEAINANYHSVVVEGLQPNTHYMYRVGEKDFKSEWFHTKTSGSLSDKLSFIYLGDPQTGLSGLWPRALREAYKKMPEAQLILYAGDIVNRGNADYEWGELFYGAAHIFAEVPNMLSPGNHEYARTGDTLSAFWKPQFTLPENGPKGLKETAYYSDVQNARFISINSNQAEYDKKDRKNQKKWVEYLLKNNPHAWTVVTFHHPFYSIRATRDNKNMRKAFKPLFDKYKVDLVLQGHDHAYARGNKKVPGAKTGTVSEPVYVISVSGPKMSSRYDGTWMDVSASNLQLYQLITIENDTLNYKAYDVAGNLQDAFELIKKQGSANQLIERK